MRKRMTEDCDARILLGGKVSGFEGSMPGIAEEALLAFEAKKPLFLLGGFGGCARDIIAELGHHEGWPRRSAGEVGPQYRDGYEAAMVRLRQVGSLDQLRNGLTPLDNRVLFESRNLPEIIRLVLLGID